MTDVFISYAREDRTFVQRLHHALAADGHDAWVDWEGIPASAKWLAEIRTAIDEAECFCFVVSPDSVGSTVCREEAAIAAASNKRIVPLLYRDVPDGAVPEPVAALNWIEFRDTDDFDQAFSTLIKALETEPEHVHTHTRLLVRAKEWETSSRDRSRLLRGTDLTEAEAWLGSSQGKEPVPTQLHAAYVLGSRRAASRRQRTTIAAVALALVVSLVLSVVALAQRGTALRNEDRAVRQAAVARARELAGAAVANLDVDSQRSLLLAIEAVRTTRAMDGTVLREAEQALHHAVQADRLVRTIQTGASAVVRYSADGQRLLSPGPEPGTANIYDAVTGEVVSSIAGHGTDSLSHVNWSPDGRLISTSSRSAASTVVLDAATGERLLELTLPSGEPVCCWAEFSPNGKLIASNTFEGPVFVWDVASGEQLGEIPFGGPLAFSPDGSALWVDACVFDLPALSKRYCVDPGRDVIPTDVSWPAESDRVAMSTSAGTVALWDAVTGEESMTLLMSAGDIRDIELARGGDRLAVGLGNGTASIWDLSETAGREAFVLAGHDAGIQSMKFHPDETQLATASEDGAIKIWDVALDAGGETLTRPSTGAIAYLGANALAVGREDGSVELSDAATGERLDLLAAGHGAVVQLVGDRSGSTLATAAEDGTVTVWDLEATEPMLEIATDRWVNDLAYSPRAGVLATLADDLTATLWDASTGDEIHTVEGVYNALALSPDGAFLVGPWDPTFEGDGEVRIWSTDTWEVVHEVIAPPFSFDVAFSGDGALLSIVGLDGFVRLVDTGDWNVRSFTGNLGRTWGAAIDQRGTRIATASDAGLQVWDSSAGQLALILTDVPFPPVSGVDMAFSPDGTRLVAPTVDGAATVYLFEVDELLDLARGDLTRGFTDQECRRYLHLARCAPT